nr:PREDICTED: lysosomal Pro-X carboxypeptidase [Bemisia tabaci]
MGGKSLVFFCVITIVWAASTVFAEDYTYETKYLDVPVSHFDFSKNATFKLRYLVNDTFWSRRKGPIFFYTGNEGDIELFARNTGFMWDIAAEFRAMLVFAEHRYYGKSMPFGDNSFSSPEYSGYLTSTEAMVDFVDVIYQIWGETKVNSPVIAFGGSYGGMLSAWIRMKYPAVILGSLASSAPIWQFEGMTPCSTAFKIVTDVFSMADKECSATIRKAWSIIDKQGQSEDGRRLLSKSWNLCKELNNTKDVETFKAYINEACFDLAMINYPYPTNFLAPVPAWPVKAVCSYMNDSSVPDLELLDKLFRGISVYSNYTGQTKCLDVDLDDNTAGLSYSGWDIQSCTEMVMPMCADGVNDMFEPDEWNLQNYSDTCVNKYKLKPDPRIIEKLYGGKNINDHKNIIFSNGLLDPWSGGGVMKDISSSIFTVIIPESAHHLDLRAADPADPDSVKQARKHYKKIFRAWLEEHYRTSAQRTK